MDELALALEHGSARAAPPQPHRRDQVSGLPYSSKQLLRLLRPGGRARAAGTSATRCASRSRTACCAAWAARRRSGGAAAGRRRTRRCRLDARRRRARVTIGDPGHRHRHAHAARRWWRPRSSASPLDRVRRRRRRHRPERLRPGGGRLADDAVGDARGARGRGEGAQAPLLPLAGRRVRDLGRRPRDARRADPLEATARSTSPSPR